MHDQHFMTDRIVLKRMVAAAGIGKGDTVLEIGAGRGHLTRELAGKAGKVIAVEIDRSLESDLRRNLEGVGNVELVFGNALKVIRGLDFSRIVSNIPYAISEPLLREIVFLDFDSALLALPRSFAERLVSGPGDRGFGTISILAREFFRTRILFGIPREAFDPKPRTRSVVVLLEKKVEESLFCRVYLEHRMKLKNAIMKALTRTGECTKNQARKQIKSLEINNLLDKRIAEMEAEELKTAWKRLQKIRTTPGKNT